MTVKFFPRLIWSELIKYRWSLTIYWRWLFVPLLTRSSFCLYLWECEMRRVLPKGSLVRLSEDIILCLLMFAPEENHQHLSQLFQLLCDYSVRINPNKGILIDLFLSIWDTSLTLMASDRYLLKLMPFCVSLFRTFHRELLAIYLIDRHLQHQLKGRYFVIFTDHKPLTFVA